MTQTSKNSKTVTISTRMVGQHFGHEGIVKCGSKVIWVSGCFPYGFTANAYAAAEDHAKAEGWTIRGAAEEAGRL